LIPWLLAAQVAVTADLAAAEERHLALSVALHSEVEAALGGAQAQLAEVTLSPIIGHNWH
jgi:hypothetical protein